MLFTSVGVLAVLAAGCGSEAVPPSNPLSSTTATASSGTNPTPPASLPLPSTSRAASPEAAADGTDYSACRDGECEVFVNGKVVIPLDRKFGFTSFEVTYTRGSTAVFGGDPVNGNLRSTIGGTGELNTNGITMEILSADSAGAVLHFTPRID